MREVQGLGDLREHVDELPPPEAPNLGAHRAGEILALEQLHHDEERAARELAEVAHLDDVPAAEQVRRLRLAHEPLEHGLGAIGAGAQHLHGADLPDHDVPARVDGAHTALADDALDPPAPLDDGAEQVLRAGLRVAHHRHHGYAVLGARGGVVGVLPLAHRADLHDEHDARFPSRWRSPL